mgnify:FL=1
MSIVNVIDIYKCYRIMCISKFKWSLPMLGFFKNKKKENKDIDEEGKSYDPDNIIVYYEGTLI